MKKSVKDERKSIKNKPIRDFVKEFDDPRQ